MHERDRDRKSEQMIENIYFLKACYSAQMRQMHKH